MIPPGRATTEPKSGQGEDPAAQPRVLTPYGGAALAEPSGPGALGAASVVVSLLAAGSDSATAPRRRLGHLAGPGPVDHALEVGAQTPSVPARPLVHETLPFTGRWQLRDPCSAGDLAASSVVAKRPVTRELCRL